MIRSVSYDQNEILKDVIQLHVPGGFQLDPTFGKGNFYKEIPKPEFCYDLSPRFDFVREADARHLPHEDSSIKSILCDFPFIHAHGKESIIGKQFSSYKSQAELQKLYYEAMVEFYRVLKPKGFLVKKVQDVTESGKQVWTHCLVYNMALEIGFYPKDLFHLIAKHRIEGHNHKNQKHARKFSSYFWVFQKK